MKSADRSRSRTGFGATTMLAATLAAMLSQTARADDRRFTYVDENRHGAPAGHLEFEQYFTWKTHTENDSDFDRYEFRHEFEYGITDDITLAIDVANWHHLSDSTRNQTVYDDTALELKIRFTDPIDDLFGIGWKTELKLGREHLKYENILIVDKVIDRWEFAYNFLIEAEWEGESYFDYDESGGELKQAFGISYELAPAWFIGAELVHEIPLPDWSSGKEQNLYIGPNVSYRNPGEWALTVTGLFLAAGADDEPEFQLRAIFEVDF